MDERHVYRTPAQRLALLPTDRHVRYKCRQDGFWQADWRNDQGKIHHHYLGKDTDGTFAQARADNLAKRIPRPLKQPATDKPCHHVHIDLSCMVCRASLPHPYMQRSIAMLEQDHAFVEPAPKSHIVTIKDEQGKPLYIDESLAYFFQPPMPKVVYVRNGVRCVTDCGLGEGRTGQQTKYTKLHVWLHETWFARGTEKGYEVVQKCEGNDFCLSNLIQVKKARKAS